MRFLRALGLALAIGALGIGAGCQDSAPPTPGRVPSAREPTATGPVTAALTPEPPALPSAESPPLPDQDDPAIPADLPHLRRLFPKESKKLTFAVFGDRFWGDTSGWTVFDRAVEEVNHLGPDFIIDVGDHIDGMSYSSEMTAGEWKEYLEHAGRARVPWFFTAGNHDIYGREMYDYWRKSLGRTYYAFDRQGCHFIVLNTEEGEGSGGYGLTDAQVDWVKRDVAALVNPRHIFVFMHEPVFLFDGYGEGRWSSIESALQGKPYTVFAGHYHRLEKYVREGRPYFILGPTGAGFYGEPGRANGVFQHYTVVTVDGKDVSLTFIEPGYAHGEEVIAAPRSTEAGGAASPPVP